MSRFLFFIFTMVNRRSGLFFSFLKIHLDAEAGFGSAPARIRYAGAPMTDIGFMQRRSSIARSCSLNIAPSRL